MPGGGEGWGEGGEGAEEAERLDDDAAGELIGSYLRYL